MDKRHRTSMSGIKVRDESGWGIDTAFERYGGKPDYFDGAPRPKGSPFGKDPEGRPASFNEVANDWRRGAGKGGVECAEGKPGYVASPKPSGGYPYNAPKSAGRGAGILPPRLRDDPGPWLKEGTPRKK
jgi:hypothetical protein